MDQEGVWANTKVVTEKYLETIGVNPLSTNKFTMLDALAMGASGGGTI